MNTSKVEVQSLTLANATTAQKKSFPIDTPSDFSTCRGFYIIRNSGSDYLKIGISDGAGNSILAPVNITHLSVSNTVAIAQKFFTGTPFAAGGKKINVTIENFATTASIQDTDIVLLYDNKPIV